MGRRENLFDKTLGTSAIEGEKQSAEEAAYARKHGIQMCAGMHNVGLREAAAMYEVSKWYYTGGYKRAHNPNALLSDMVVEGSVEVDGKLHSILSFRVGRDPHRILAVAGGFQDEFDIGHGNDVSVWCSFAPYRRSTSIETAEYYVRQCCPANSEKGDLDGGDA